MPNISNFKNRHQHLIRFLEPDYIAKINSQLNLKNLELRFIAGNLSLIDLNNAKLKNNYLDFTQGKIAFRAQQLLKAYQQDILAKVLNSKSRSMRYRIIDATGGLGHDAWIMAGFGHTVTIIERVLPIGCLLFDALLRASLQDQYNLHTDQLTLNFADSQQWLQKLESNDYPDIVYLDPMFPVEVDKMRNNKFMRFLRLICGDDLDADKLFEAALQTAKYKVIVKRHRHAPYINDHQPTYMVHGTHGRFDVYQQ